MSWSTDDVPLCSELAHGSQGLFLLLPLKALRTSGSGSEQHFSSHADLNQNPTLQPLKYDSASGPLVEATDSTNFNENMSGTHMSSSHQRFNGSYIPEHRGNLTTFEAKILT